MMSFKKVLLLFFVIFLSIAGICKQNVLMIVDEFPDGFSIVGNTYVDGLKKYLTNSEIGVLDERNIEDIQNLKNLIEKGVMDKIKDIYNKWGLESTTKLLKINLSAVPNLDNLLIKLELIDIKGSTLYIESVIIGKGKSYIANKYASVHGKELLYELIQLDKELLKDERKGIPQLDVYTKKPYFSEGEEISIYFSGDLASYINVFYVIDSHLEIIIANKLIESEETYSLKGKAALPTYKVDEYLETLLFIASKKPLKLENVTLIEELNEKLSLIIGIDWEYKFISYVITGS